MNEKSFKRAHYGGVVLKYGFQMIKFSTGIIFCVFILLLCSCSKRETVDADSKMATKESLNDSVNDIKTSRLTIVDATMKVLPPGQQVGAVYLKIQNPLPKTHILNYVHSDMAENIEVHRHIYDNGMMQMRQVQHLMVDAQSELLFKPGGYHLMLFGIHKRLAVGDRFSVWFEFNGQSPIEVVVNVKAP